MCVIVSNNRLLLCFQLNAKGHKQYISTDSESHRDEEQGGKADIIAIFGADIEQATEVEQRVEVYYHAPQPPPSCLCSRIMEPEPSCGYLVLVISCFWLFLFPAAIMSMTCESKIFARVNPSNCNLQLFNQSATLKAQSHDVSSWYFQDWGLFSNKGFCPLESYIYDEYIDTDGNHHRKKVYQNCISWSSSVWKDWDSQNVGSGKTYFRQGAAVWSNSLFIERFFGFWVFNLGSSTWWFWFIGFGVLDLGGSTWWLWFIGRYCRVVVALLSISFLPWVVLFGLLLGTDQLDPMALQKNMFPSCNVSVNKLYDGSIFAICIIILGGLNLLFYTYSAIFSSRLEWVVEEFTDPIDADRVYNVA